MEQEKDLNFKLELESENDNKNAKTEKSKKVESIKEDVKLENEINLDSDLVEVTYEDDVVQRSPFTPSLDEYNGLNIAYLSNIYIKDVEFTKKPDNIFYGKTVPKLCIEFASDIKVTKETIQRFYTWEFSPIQVADKYMVIFDGNKDKVTHILSQFTKNKPKTLFYKEAPITKPIDDVLTVYRNMFQTIVDFAKQESIIPTEQEIKEGKLKYVWLKLVANKSGDRLEFPQYIGTGFIERKISNKPVIAINVAKGETIKLRPKENNSNNNNNGGIGLDLSDANTEFKFDDSEIGF